MLVILIIVLLPGSEDVDGFEISGWYQRNGMSGSKEHNGMGQGIKFFDTPIRFLFSNLKSMILRIMGYTETKIQILEKVSN